MPERDFEVLAIRIARLFMILVEHTIDTGQALPVKQHPRRVPLSKIQEAEAENFIGPN
jgi:hypothetical protein